jgi:phage shock protein A
MPKEVEIESDDYEVIPVGPIRKLEERIRKMEREKESFAYEGFMREILELIQSNQKLVDEIVKANDSLRDELAKIPGKIDELLQTWRDFIKILKEVGGAEATSTSMNQQFNKLVEQNQEMLDSIKSLKSRRMSKGIEAPKKYPKIKIRR